MHGEPAIQAREIPALPGEGERRLLSQDEVEWSSLPIKTRKQEREEVVRERVTAESFTTEVEGLLHS